MSWRSRLRRVTFPDGREMIGASFRGVPFFVDSAERSGGRRTVTHEFPGRDEPYVEDMGRSARSFPIDGYVVGPNYKRDSDALIAALEDVDGPGELVHPYHGIRNAICTGLTVRESKGDGGMASFSISFAETSLGPPAPTEETDTVGAVDAAADAAVDAADAEFVDAFDVDGQPSFALESLAAEIANVGEVLEDALAGVATTSQDLAKMSAAMRLISLNATALVRTPGDVASTLLVALATLEESIADAPRPVLQALVRAYYSIGNGTLAPATTSTRERERANQEALGGLLRRVVAVEAARLVVFVPFDTVEDATATADSIAEILDAEAAVAGDSFPLIAALRGEVLAAVPGNSLLSRIVSIEQPVAVPSLLLAYRVFGHVDNEADIVARNTATHPAFMSGTIRVLTDV